MTTLRTPWFLALALLAVGVAGWWLGMHRVRRGTPFSTLLRFPANGPPAAPRYYATRFPKSENSISEGGTWINSGDCRDRNVCAGAGGSNVQTAPGVAFGTQSGAVPPPYTDSAALLKGTWDSDQLVQITVWWDGKSGTNSDYDEVEIRLRGTLGKGWTRTYNINCRVGTPSRWSYIQMGRANGPSNDFTPPIAECKGIQCGCQNGDVITGTVTNNSLGQPVLRAYINDVKVIEGTDTDSAHAIASGAPGFGFFHQGNSADNRDFGISSFTALSF